MRLSALGFGVLLIGLALGALLAPMHDESARDTSSCGTLLHPKDACAPPSEVYSAQLTSVVLLAVAGSVFLVYSVVARPRDPAPSSSKLRLQTH